jgi:hypothetical protein
MKDLYINFIFVLLGMSVLFLIFLFMSFLLFLKNRFKKIFNNIDSLVSRINTFLDSSNKHK